MYYVFGLSTAADASFAKVGHASKILFPHLVADHDPAGCGEAVSFANHTGRHHQGDH